MAEPFSMVPDPAVDPLSPEAAAQAAAARVRRSVAPPGGRQEGMTTRVIDSVWPGVLNSVTRPVRIFGALSQMPPGEAPSDHPEIVDNTAALAFDLMGLGTGASALAVPKASAGIFGGRLAKTADLGKLEQAQGMAGNGLDRRAIWDQTGWFQGKDGHWKFEIPDDRAAVVGMRENPEAAPLGSQISHPEAAAAYPDLMDASAEISRVNPKLETKYGTARGSFSPGTGMIRATGDTSEAATGVALHEMQHGIQKREGFASGGSPMPFVKDRAMADSQIEEVNGILSDLSKVMDRAKASGDTARYAQAKALYDQGMNAKLEQLVPRAQADPYQNYRNVAGEVEARNVQTRKDMTPEQRRQTPPWETEDVPADKQILRPESGGPQMSILGRMFGRKPAAPQPFGSMAPNELSLYHGTTEPGFDKLSVAGSKNPHERAVFFADNPNFAGSYAEGEGARVFRYRLKDPENSLYTPTKKELEKLGASSDMFKNAMIEAARRNKIGVKIDHGDGQPTYAIRSGRNLEPYYAGGEPFAKTNARSDRRIADADSIYNAVTAHPDYKTLSKDDRSLVSDILNHDDVVKARGDSQPLARSFDEHTDNDFFRKNYQHYYQDMPKVRSILQSVDEGRGRGMTLGANSGDKSTIAAAEIAHHQPFGSMAPSPPSRGAFKPYTGPADEAMLGVHNTRTDRLQKADQIGGFAVPSMAIVKPSHGFNSFGDISMVAPRSLVTPGRGNPVFGSDVYSPRFPSLNDEGTKIFKGFTDMGNRRYAPLTLDNVVKEMKGNVRGGESFNYGAGSIRARVTPQFGSGRDVQASRGKIITREEFEPHAEAANHELVNLSQEFEPYYKYAGRGFEHTRDFSSILSEGGTRALAEHYKDVPPELMDRTRSFLNRLRDMPTQYFEGKPQRGVRIGEFSGAVVPDKEMAAVAPILEKHGIKQIEQYHAGDNETLRNQSRRDALMRFPQHFFANSTDAKTGAVIQAAARQPFGSLAPDAIPLKSKDRRLAIENYAGGHSFAANKLLREGPEAFNKEYSAYGSRYPRQVQKTIDSLDRMHAPLENDETLYRAMPVPKDVKAGDVLSDKGFMSTSRKTGFAGGIAEHNGFPLVEIKAPKGSKAIDLKGSPAEANEVVLPRNSSIRVNSVEGNRIRAELVGNHEPFGSLAPRESTPPQIDRTQTGWTFKNVASPHKLMEPGDWRTVAQASRYGEGVQNVELPIRSLNAGQKHVNENFADVADHDAAPFVIKKAGQYFLRDGHHRIVREAAKGKQTAKVRLIDLDGTTQTSFPLLDAMGAR